MNFSEISRFPRENLVPLVQRYAYFVFPKGLSNFLNSVFLECFLVR